MQKSQIACNKPVECVGVQALIKHGIEYGGLQCANPKVAHLRLDGFHRGLCSRSFRQGLQCGALSKIGLCPMRNRRPKFILVKSVAAILLPLWKWSARCAQQFI